MRLVVSLTTLPSRLPHLSAVLTCLENQTLKPDAIYLNLPDYSEKEKTFYTIPDNLDLTNVIVQRCPDYGPITKLIPTLETETSPDTLIVTLDDDMHYSPDCLQQLVDWYQKDPDGAWSGDGWIVGSYLKLYGYIYQPKNATRVSIIQGCSACIYRRDFFELEDLLNYPSKYKTVARANDDIWVSGYLAKRGIRRWVHPNFTKRTTNVSKISSLSGNAIKMFIGFYPLLNYFRGLGVFNEVQVAPLMKRVGTWIALIVLLLIGLGVLAYVYYRRRKITSTVVSPSSSPVSPVVSAPPSPPSVSHVSPSPSPSSSPSRRSQKSRSRSPSPVPTRPGQSAPSAPRRA